MKLLVYHMQRLVRHIWYDYSCNYFLPYTIMAELSINYSLLFTITSIYWIKSRRDARWLLKRSISARMIVSSSLHSSKVAFWFSIWDSFSWDDPTDYRTTLSSHSLPSAFPISFPADGDLLLYKVKYSFCNQLLEQFSFVTFYEMKEIIVTNFNLLLHFSTNKKLIKGHSYRIELPIAFHLCNLCFIPFKLFSQLFQLVPLVLSSLESILTNPFYSNL